MMKIIEKGHGGKEGKRDCQKKKQVIFHIFPYKLPVFYFGRYKENSIFLGRNVQFKSKYSFIIP